MTGDERNRLPAFDRRFFASDHLASVIGDGEVGGKASGLLRAEATLARAFPDGIAGVDIGIPRMVILTTSVYEAFLRSAGLDEVIRSAPPDDRIGNAFLRADFPVGVLGDLRALVEQVHQPLAIRSSSLLEDRASEPFAGVYVTKMIPNRDPDPAVRFRRLVDAIKLVWASTFFREARDYLSATSSSPEDERMAVIIQEVVGERHGERFYPELSGVGRTWNFYPFGSARREDGVVSLALGLGKRIVDGEVSWTYSPAHPRMPPPFASVRDRLKSTQLDFWAIGMGRSPSYDPVREAEYLVRSGIADADYDGTLRFVASTLDPGTDRLTPGVSRPGPRVVDFAPLLVHGELPVNEVVSRILTACREEVGLDVEIEFAATLESESGGARFRLLQVRPMVVSSDAHEIPEEEYGDGALVVADPALGNGSRDDLCDVVYVRPDRFDRARTREIAAEVGRFNDRLVEEGRDYILLGFGRWGSSDPWLGIPVNWAQIRGARAIVETTLPDVMPDPSQGSHFFHNVTSFGVYYFYVRPDTGGRVDWSWFDSKPAVEETTHVRRIRLDAPLVVKVDGRSGRGVVRVAGPVPSARDSGGSPG